MPETEANNRITLLTQSMLCKIKQDLTLADGKRVNAGSTVLVLPETIAQCVLLPEGRTLAEILPDLSRSGHTHTEVIGMAEQMIRLSTRLAAIEQEII